jgi:hypothetical protein
MGLRDSVTPYKGLSRHVTLFACVTIKGLSRHVTVSRRSCESDSGFPYLQLALADQPLPATSKCLAVGGFALASVENVEAIAVQFLELLGVFRRLGTMLLHNVGVCSRP